MKTNTYHSKHLLSSFFLPRKFCCRLYVTWHGTSLWSVSCAPSQLVHLPAPSLAGQCATQRRPWLCASTAQQQLNHWCVINTDSIINPKHGTTLATVKKINFMQAKTSTLRRQMRDSKFITESTHDPTSQ